MKYCYVIDALTRSVLNLGQVNCGMCHCHCMYNVAVWLWHVW